MAAERWSGASSATFSAIPCAISGVKVGGAGFGGAGGGGGGGIRRPASRLPSLRHSGPPSNWPRATPGRELAGVWLGISFDGSASSPGALAPRPNVWCPGMGQLAADRDAFGSDRYARANTIPRADTLRVLTPSSGRSTPEPLTPSAPATVGAIMAIWRLFPSLLG